MASTVIYQQLRMGVARPEGMPFGSNINAVANLAGRSGLTEIRGVPNHLASISPPPFAGGMG